VPNFAESVTVAIGTGPGSGTLSGTTTVAATSGIASFRNLRIASTGASYAGLYALRASTPGLSPAVSTAFTVACGTNCWSVNAAIPTARSDWGVGVANGRLYAVGGYRGVDAVGTVEVYDPGTDSWTTKAQMPTARLGLGVSVVNGVLYAVGGFIPFVGPVGTVEAYDPTTNTWTTRASMPTPREFLAVGVVNGILYAVGGYQSVGGAQTAMRTVEAYDPVSDTWSAKNPLPTARGLLGVGVVNGILYAVGGTAPNNVVEAYDPVANTWMTKAPMPTTRSGLGVGVLNGVLYAVGGVFSPGSTSGFMNTVEAYDATTNTWTTKASMPSARSELGVGVLNNTLYAIGGFAMIAANTYAQAGTNEAYSP
jgi:N-acetylneuraminic acid mutarotase